MKIKTLEKLMTYDEALEYINNHQDYRFPTLEEARELDYEYPYWVEGEKKPDMDYDNVFLALTNMGARNVLYRLKIVVIKKERTIYVAIKFKNAFRMLLTSIFGIKYNFMIGKQEYEFVKE